MLYERLKWWIIAFFCGGSSLFASQEIKAVIFDCDGILVDSEYLKFLALQEALASQHIEFSLEEYMPLVGHTSKYMLQKLRESKKIEISNKVIEFKKIRYKALQELGVPAIQPMVDFARYLSDNRLKLGFVLGLASSASKGEILVNLKQIGLENAFDLVISGIDDLDDYVDAEGKNKPKPYIYIEAAKRLNVPPECCLVFEDTKAGVDAAAGAGMIPIAVPNQYTLNHDFSKAFRVISSHEEFYSWLIQMKIFSCTVLGDQIKYWDAFEE
jgi:beta-phosphoglucomutase-like phosphatase (HAD superfamily)